ncbi:hypothetical protein J2W97_005279 [Paenibacillus jamilae]|nr:hypothetical protein [Paenibacillus jamilae]
MALLALSMTILIDLLSGMSLFEAFHSIRAAFANTAIPEVIVMVFFLFLPFVNVITAAVRKRSLRK